MPKLMLPILPFALGAWLLLVPAAAQAFFCGERLIELGAPEQDVRGQCGAPDAREDWEEELLLRSGHAHERSTSVSYSEWIYDLGTDRLLRILRFRDGLLRHVELRHYAPSTGGDCSARIIEPGETKYEVLKKCGPPATRQQTTEKRLEPLDQLLRRRYPITTERWIYNGHGNALPRVVVLRNRRVIEIETGAKP